MNPSFIVGPLLLKTKGTSQDVITGIFDGRLSKMPYVFICCVDIRNVADAHVKALTSEPGHRYPIAEGNYGIEELTQIIQEKYNKEGFNIKFSYVSKWLMWALSFIDNEANYSYKKWGARCMVDSSKTKKMLNIDFIPIKTSILDMAESLIALGFVKKPEAN